MRLFFKTMWAIGFYFLEDMVLASGDTIKGDRVVDGLYGHHGAGLEGMELRRLLEEVPAAFRLDMVPMGLPFALIGALIGLLMGFWLEARSRRFEMEKRLLAVDTLRQLMITLAHHLLNAVQGIGGFAALALRKEMDEDKRRPLEIISRHFRQPLQRVVP